MIQLYRSTFTTKNKLILTISLSHDVDKKENPPSITAITRNFTVFAIILYCLI